MFLKLWNFLMIWCLLPDLKTIILCSVHSIWFVEYVLCWNIWFVKALTRIVEYEYKLLNQTQIYRGKFPAIHLKKRFDNSARKSKKKKKSCKLVHREKYFTWFCIFVTKFLHDCKFLFIICTVGVGNAPKLMFFIFILFFWCRDFVDVAKIVIV